MRVDRGIVYSAIATVWLLAMVGAGRVQAQHYVGVRAGYGSGTARFYLPQDMSSIWGLYSGGVSWKYYTKERYVGAIEVDVMFMQQGFIRGGENVAAEFGGNSADTTGLYHRRINSVMVPIFWQPHAYLFKRKMRVFLNLGVTFSYNLSSTEKATTKDPAVVGGILMEQRRYPMLLTRDNRWGYGLCAGGGIGWSVGRVETFAEVRYYFGYSDILRNKTKYEYNPIRSPIDGMQFSAGFYVRLGRGGILSRPSKNLERKLELIELERLRKAEEGGKETIIEQERDVMEVDRWDETSSDGARGETVKEPQEKEAKEESKEVKKEVKEESKDKKNKMKNNGRE